MREEQEFLDWTQDADDELRRALSSLRQDVDAAGVPEARFVMRRAGRQRHRAVAGVAAGAAAVLGLSWFGYQALDNAPNTVPAGQTEQDEGTTTARETPPEETIQDSDAGADAAPVDRLDLFTAETSYPELSLFVPPSLWSSQTFTDGATTDSAMGEPESTMLFDCDPDDVMRGSADEGTFGIMTIWSQGRAFGAQRVRVLDSADVATGYVNDLHTALSDCQAPADATNIVLDVQKLELSGAYRVTTTFVDGTESLTDFVYVVQHEGTPEAVSTLRITDWSGTTTDSQALAELARLAALVTAN